MANISKILLVVCFYIGNCAADHITPKGALSALIKGNNRFIKEKLLHPNRDIAGLKSLKAGQLPIAVVLSCSDSRVSPEIIFDQGLGDLFIVRVAGNVLGPFELESIKYAILALKTPLIVVLGHQNCGAVKAVIKDHTTIIPRIAKQIEEHCKSENLTACIKQNVQGVVDDLKKNQQLTPFVKNSSIEIVGGYYELGTGRVAFLKGS